MSILEPDKGSPMPEGPVLTLLAQRRATRAIDTKRLSRETIDSLIEAARLTPSCFNNQPWRFLFLHGEDGLARGRKALTGGNVKWADRAPLLVAAYAKADADCQPKDGRSYHLFDTGMAVMNLMLEATHLGLVARPMAGFKPDVLKEEFDLDDADEPIVMIAIGYPGDSEDHVPDNYKGIEDKPRSRHDPAEIVRHA